MPDDPATDAAAVRRAATRRRRVLLAGHRNDVDAARRGLDDAAPEVQAAAVGALARLGALTVPDVCTALADGPPLVRRRAVEAARTVGGVGSRSTLVAAVEGALDDEDAVVVVAAAWFLAERKARHAVPRLVELATGHDDIRCREAAVAALGAIGDPAGLPAVLDALDDKPTVRRRATVALAGFDDPRVEPALARSLADKDWQVRQAAEELQGE